MFCKYIASIFDGRDEDLEIGIDVLLAFYRSNNGWRDGEEISVD